MIFFVLLHTLIRQRKFKANIKLFLECLSINRKVKALLVRSIAKKNNNNYGKILHNGHKI